MNKQEARNLVRDTFQNPFDKTRYYRLVRELLNGFEDAPFVNAGNIIPEAYKPYFTSLERIGKYEDKDRKKIDILIVKLRHGQAVERARTAQRNFIARYLNGSRGGELRDAALVAFVADDSPDWRFSLVKMDYKFKEGDDGVALEEELTPARRYSFLVGQNEASHTAQSRLVPIVQNDADNPTLDRLEEAFNIETVTKEFFNKYRDLFIRTKEELDQAVKRESKVKADFKQKDVDTVNFAKKLLGQIIFLYFLQKKGWFGVPRDGAWGDGSKGFLRELFERKHGDYKNFFNDILEHLFYDALRNDRSHDDHFYGRFNCKIPFLNGGLFDPLNDYDWIKADILLSNDLFSNTRVTNEGDTGDGLLDIFDRYNFTVKEDEPFEKEVAIDPELLGKAYEKFNAIRPDNYEEYLKALESGKKGEESKFNKQYGVYYTPREIVHYMCQQSLINYLYTELNPNSTYQALGDDQTEMFGSSGDNGQAHMTVKHEPIVQVPMEDIETLILRGEQIKEHDARVTSAGQETETYSFRMPETIRKNANIIDQKLGLITACDPAVGSGAFPVGLMSEIVNARDALVAYSGLKKNIYDFKRECIENSLYGVDIDAGAVEIAKLRLWLSLVVDEGDPLNIKPLPNLDYKIVQGDSLMGFPENWGSPIEKQIEKLIHQHFNETSPNKKDELKRKIDEQIQSRYAESLRALGYQVTFDYKTVFSEIFQRKGGFDLVIANPPYIRQEEITGLKRFLDREFRVFSARSDIYTYFYEKGTRLLKPNGELVIISSNKFMRAKYGEKLREYIKTNFKILEILDFGDIHKFDAVTNTVIVFLQNYTDKNGVFKFSTDLGKHPVYFKQRKLERDAWTLADKSVLSLKEKIERLGIRLDRWNVKISYGIKAGFNDAFVISREQKDKFIKENPNNKAILKPLLRGRDISRYHKSFAETYIIFSKYQGGESLKSKYPEIVEHLTRFEKQLKNRGQVKNGQHHWLELDNNPSQGYLDLFAQNKIIWLELSDKNKFTYTEDGECILAGAFMLTGESLKYLLAFFNSRLCLFYFKLICNSSGMATTQWKKFVLERVPVLMLTEKEQQPFIILVNKILAITKDKDYSDNNTKQKIVHRLENQIDELFYTLYKLTDEEIRIVEGNNA